MRALSLHQPWASLVAWGVKRIETRSWDTSYRGQIVIHATKAVPWPEAEFRLRCASPPFGEHLWGLGGDYDHLPRGFVLARGVLAAVFPTDRLINAQGRLHTDFAVDGRTWHPRLEEGLGDFAKGRYAWLLADVVPYPSPIPAAGRQGLWDWPGPEAPFVERPGPGSGLIDLAPPAKRRKKR